MICPKCQSPTRSMKITRFTDGSRRRRECLNPECLYRFNTAEVVYGKAFAACRGKRLVQIDGEGWVPVKTLREVALLKLRHKRATMTPEEREEAIRKMLFGDSGRGLPLGLGENENGEDSLDVPGVEDNTPPWHDDDETGDNDDGRRD